MSARICQNVILLRAFYIFRCGIKTTPEPKSNDIARLLFDKIYKKEAVHPKFLINNVNVLKLDVNAARDVGTFNQELPNAIYDRYHSLATMAIDAFGGKEKRGILINVHTYCDEHVQWTSLGK